LHRHILVHCEAACLAKAPVPGDPGRGCERPGSQHTRKKRHRTQREVRHPRSHRIMEAPDVTSWNEVRTFSPPERIPARRSQPSRLLTMATSSPPKPLQRLAAADREETGSRSAKLPRSNASKRSENRMVAPG